MLLAKSEHSIRNSCMQNSRNLINDIQSFIPAMAHFQAFQGLISDLPLLTWKHHSIAFKQLSRRFIVQVKLLRCVYYLRAQSSPFSIKKVLCVLSAFKWTALWFTAIPLLQSQSRLGVKLGGFCVLVLPSCVLCKTALSYPCLVNLFPGIHYVRKPFNPEMFKNRLRCEFKGRVSVLFSCVHFHKSGSSRGYIQWLQFSRVLQLISYAFASFFACSSY